MRGWDRRNAYYFQLIQSLARHAQFDIEAPFESLPREIKNLVLFGSGDEQIEFKYLDGKGGTVKRKHAFEGIVNNLERRYQRDRIADGARGAREVPLGPRPAPSAMARGSTAPRSNVFVDGKSAPEVSSLIGRSRRRVLRRA